MFKVLKNKGFTLLELIANVAISSIILLDITMSLIQISNNSLDITIKSRTDEEAKAILDIVAYDMRMIGSGMPIGQPMFSMTDATLGNSPLPILTTATNRLATVRLNETGIVHVLTANLSPNTSRTTTLNTVEGLAVGDTVYISDMVRGGSQGLRGIIESINGLNITIQTGYTMSPAAVFTAGSHLAKVNTITYTSPDSNWSGITRTVNGTSYLLTPDSKLLITYHTSSGSEITIPLTESIIKDSLTSVRIKVEKKSSRKLNSGDDYIAIAEQQIALRNLFLVR